MNRVLVLGRTGMLGHMVYQVLNESREIEVQGTTLHDKSDAFYFDAEKGLSALGGIWSRASGYDYVINCIGALAAAIKVDVPSSLRRAIKLNAVFPHELAAFAKTKGAKVIHISTDGVFSGNVEHYDEDATHDCTDLYGITKSLGEVSDDDDFLNVRCSIVGPSPYERGGLLEWFLSQQPGSAVSGFTDQIWHGVSTYQFAELCRTIIEGDHFKALREESPVFHFAPNEPLSKYQLLRLFRDEFQRAVTVEAADSGDKAFTRILDTKYKKMREFYRHGISAPEMVSELAKFMKSKEKERT